MAKRLAEIEEIQELKENAEKKLFLRGRLLLHASNGCGKRQNATKRFHLALTSASARIISYLHITHNSVDSSGYCT